MTKSIYNANFNRLKQLGIIMNDTLRSTDRSTSSGYMDLALEPIEYLDNYHQEGTKAFSIAHYFEQHGDLCQDPEMVVFVDFDNETCEAYSFQQAIPPLYQCVYPTPESYRPSLRGQLNKFLGEWLLNLIAQGHGKNWKIMS